MKTHFPLPVLIIVMTVVSVACSLINLPGFQKLETGSTRTFPLNESIPGPANVQDVSLSIAMGDITLAGGADSLLEGEVSYNVDDWKPVVLSQDNSLAISQDHPEDTTRGFPIGEIVNMWKVKLGDTPMNLTVNATTSDAFLDLSGLPLQRLDVQDSLGNSEIRFESLNPERMQTLSYKTDVSDVTFHGLANANFTEMIFEGRGGNYIFDFSGDLQEDTRVNIKVSFSEVQILVPPGIPAEVYLEGKPSSVSMDDAWMQGNDRFQIGQGIPKLTIMLHMTAGNLKFGTTTGE
jgi:hypothetical protein